MKSPICVELFKELLVAPAAVHRKSNSSWEKNSSCLWFFPQMFEEKKSSVQWQASMCRGVLKNKHTNKQKNTLHLNSVFNLSTLASYIFFPSTQSI